MLIRYTAGDDVADEDAGLQHIRANADMVVEQFGASSGLERFGFDAPSVEWLEGFIERQRIRDDVSPEFVRKMVSVLGSYLGECIIRSYGGHWAVGEDGWRVEFDEKNAAFPFAKVQKQFANGIEAGDSVYSFFTAIPLVFRRMGPSGPRYNQPMQRTGAAGWFTQIRKWFGRGPGR